MQTKDHTDHNRPDAKDTLRPVPAISPQGTTLARHIAAAADGLCATILAIVSAKQLDESWIVPQLVVATLVYLGYYFVCEAMLGRTPGKMITQLVVLDFDGGNCSVRQVLIRTAFRVLEVNPFLLGGLPAAVSIIWSRDKQRLGDKAAATIVVHRPRLSLKELMVSVTLIIVFLALCARLNG